MPSGNGGLCVLVRMCDWVANIGRPPGRSRPSHPMMARIHARWRDGPSNREEVAVSQGNAGRPRRRICTWTSSRRCSSPNSRCAIPSGGCLSRRRSTNLRTPGHDAAEDPPLKRSRRDRRSGPRSSCSPWRAERDLRPGNALLRHDVAGLITQGRPVPAASILGVGV